MRYNAFDLDLQLWVAACFYKGGVDIYRIFVGELEEDAERHYREGMSLAHHVAGAAGDVAARTGRPLTSTGKSRWPRCTSTTLSASTCIRSRRAGCVGCGCRAGCSADRTSSSLLITTGFLPQQFRDEMRLPWDAGRQRRFDRLMAVLRTANRLMPRFVRRFPFNVLLWDLDRRIKTGRPLV